MTCFWCVVEINGWHLVILSSKRREGFVKSYEKVEGPFPVGSSYAICIEMCEILHV